MKTRTNFQFIGKLILAAVLSFSLVPPDLVRAQVTDSTTLRNLPLQVLGANITSAANLHLELATGDLVHVTGTTTVTALGTVMAGREMVLIFDGILTLTHNATSLHLPAEANITTAAKDVAVFRSLGSGNWICVNYAPGAGGTGATLSGAESLSNKTLVSPTVTTKIIPTTTDGATLGDSTHLWSDGFLASGFVWDYGTGNVVVTHSSGILTMGTGEWRITTPGTNTASVVTVGGSQTLTGKTLTSPVINTPTVKDLTEVVSATNVIAASETGTTFFLNSATEFVSTLPAPAAGLHFRFIVSAAPSGASYTIVCNAAATIIKGHVVTNDVNSGTDADFGTAGEGTITIVDGKAVAGDIVEVWCDGTNWFMRAECSVFDAITLS